MTTRIKLEEKWRLQLPEELPQALGWESGGLIEAFLDNGHIVLRPVQEAAVETSIVYRQGRPVIQTPPLAETDAVEQVRQERLLGLLDSDAVSA